MTEACRRLMAGGAAAALAVALCAASGAGTGAPPTPRQAEIARAIDDLQPPPRGADTWILRYRAIRRLAGWKAREARPALEQVLTGEAHPWLRGQALVALAEIFGEPILPTALAHAADQADGLRAGAVEALGVIASPKGDPAVTKALQDSSADVRYRAIVAIARLRRAKAWPIVAPRVRWPPETPDAPPPTPEQARQTRVAAKALPYVATPEAQRKLIALLKHPDPAVRLEAAYGLRQFANPDAAPELLERMGRDGDESVRRAAVAALLAYPPEALESHLLAAMKNKDAIDRHEAALTLLARRPTRTACDTVAALLRTAPADYRAQNVRMLALLARGEADRYHDIFRTFLTDPGAAERRQAVRCVAACKELDHFAVLKPLVADGEEGVRLAVIDALEQATEGAPPEGILAYLAPALTHAAERTFRQAVDFAAERVQPERLAKSLGPLESILAGPDEKRRTYVAKAFQQRAGEDARRQIARAQGYLTDWMVLGPFPNNKQNSGFAVAYPPELEIDFKKAYSAYTFAEGAAFNVLEPPKENEKPAEDNGAQPAPAGDAPDAPPPEPPGLSVVPPQKGGRTIVRYVLPLPAAKDLRLRLAARLSDAQAKTDGVELDVTVGEASLLLRQVPRQAAPVEVSVDLSAYAGRRVPVELAVDSLRDATRDRLILTSPRVAADGKVALDLVALATQAVARTEVAGEQTEKLNWRQVRLADTTGQLALHDIFPPPTHYKVAYAVAQLTSAAAQPVRLHVDADEGCIVWLNGKQVYAEPARKAAVLPVTLEKGDNRLLVKVANLMDWWYVSIRVADEKGARAATVRGWP